VTSRWAARSAAATFASFAVPISMVGVYWPGVRADLGRSLGDLGLVSLAYGLSRMSTALTGRRMVASFGLGHAFPIALTALMCASLATAAAPDWPLFLVAIAAVGAVSGMLDSLGAAFITAIGDISSAGLIHGMYGFGATVGPVIVVVAPGWRWSAVAAAAAVLAALCFAVSVRDAWPDITPPDPVAVEAALPPPAVPRFTIAGSLGAFAALVALEVTTGTWIFAYLTGHRAIGDETAAIGVSGFWAGLMVGRLVLARPVAAALVERLGTVVLVVISLATLGSTTVLPPAATVAAVGLTGVALGPLIPTLFARTAQRVGNVMAARMAGRQLLATNVGAIGVPTLTGFLVDQFGPGAIMIVMLTTIGVFALPLLAILRRIAPIGPEHQPA